MLDRYFIKIFVISMYFFLASQAAAQERLWPTDVNCGDCLAGRIHTVKSQYVKNLDKNFCKLNNADNTEKINACILNSSYSESVSFFTDRCSGDEYFISLNGKEHRLKRVTGNARKPPYFAGTFKGDGLKVKVASLRLVRKTYEKGSKRTEADVEDALYKVLVTVQRGSRTEEINGDLTYGR
jgi:hypothetical protein